MDNAYVVEQIHDKFNQITKKPEKFLSAPEKLIENIKECLKESYDFIKSSETTKTSNTLPNLIVQNFDVEQIWQQIELQNDDILSKHLRSVGRLVAQKDDLWLANDDEDNENDNDDEEEENNESADDENNTKDEDINDEENNTEEEEDENNLSNKKKKPNKNSKKSSAVDDDFFKLDEMEKFLNREEQPKTQKKDSDDDDDDEESVDLFDMKSDEELDDDDKEDEEESDTENPENNPKYDEFFGDGNEEEEAENNNKRKRPEEEFSDEDENLKSSLELKNERLHKRIDDIEEQALQDKSWQLKGEVTADKRPQNSLLEEIVDFDMTVRPAPVITEETTYKLEDVIRKRIKDKVWDDVERKTKLVDSFVEYKKKLMLDQEKSKQSLAQIYENEYLKQKEALDPDAADKPEEVPIEQTEIKSKMKSLFAKLDALSNFHFTPKTVAPELRIVNNIPAINMEEVLPVASSEAALLAPEEIKKKAKGDVIGKGERTKTDKNRERRQKKTKQREHAKDIQNKEKKKVGLNAKYSKQKAAHLLEKVTKDSNVNKMNESGGTTKSSTTFFTQLQDEVRGHIKKKTSQGQKNKNKPIHIAKKLKL